MERFNTVYGLCEDYSNQYVLARFFERKDNKGYFVLFDKSTYLPYFRGWLELKEEDYLGSEYIVIPYPKEVLNNRVYVNPYKFRKGGTLCEI